MVKFIGISLIALGIIILYIIGRRKFLRRGITGLEGFSSYQAAILIRFSEALFRLLAWGMLLIGAFLTGITCYNA